MKDRPKDAADLARKIKQFFNMSGAEHYHGVIEWQPRLNDPLGPCPHLHCILYYKEPPVFVPVKRRYSFRAFGIQALKIRWLRIAADCRALISGQHGSEIHDLAGWLGYMAKHAARGVAHYQRQQVLPKGWEKPGRMWFKSNNWPVRTVEYHLSDKLFYRLRRFCNRYLLSETRVKIAALKSRLPDLWGDVLEQETANLVKLVAREKFLRRQLQRKEEKNGRLVPVAEWIDQPEIERWLSQNAVSFDFVDENGEIFERQRCEGEPEEQETWQGGYSISDAELSRSDWEDVEI